MNANAQTQPQPLMLTLQAHPLLHKLSSLAASLVFSFGAGDLLGLSDWLKVIIGGVVAVILALVSRQPAMKQAEISERSLHITEAENTRDAETDKRNHEKEIYLEEMRFAHERVRYYSALENIGRRRAHAAGGELQRVTLYAQNLQILLHDNHIEIPAFEFKFAQALYGELDAELRNLIESPPVPPTPPNS